MGTDDNLRDKVEEKTGQAKEWIGAHTDHPDLGEEERGEQAGANARHAGEHVRDPAEDLKDATHRADEDSRDPAEDLKAHRD